MLYSIYMHIIYAYYAYAYMCFLYMGTLHNQLEIFDNWSFSLASDGVKYLTFCCKTSVIVYKL